MILPEPGYSIRILLVLGRNCFVMQILSLNLEKILNLILKKSEILILLVMKILGPDLAESGRLVGLSLEWLGCHLGIPRDFRFHNL